MPQGNKLHAGDIVYCEFSPRLGGKHFGLVVEVDERTGRVVVARGTTWRPWEPGGNRWFPSSLFVDDDELVGTGLHHATRFDMDDRSRERFRIDSQDIKRVGRLPETKDMLNRFTAAALNRAVRK